MLSAMPRSRRGRDLRAACSRSAMPGYAQVKQCIAGCMTMRNNAILKNSQCHRPAGDDAGVLASRHGHYRRCCYTFSRAACQRSSVAYREYFRNGYHRRSKSPNAHVAICCRRARSPPAPRWAVELRPPCGHLSADRCPGIPTRFDTPARP